MDSNNLGRLVKKMRNERGWSQRNLALRSGVSAPTISRIENGHLKMAMLAMLAIFKAFDCRVVLLALSPKSGPIHLVILGEDDNGD